jgi:hypothetical protein
MKRFERQFNLALATFQERAAFWVRWAVLFLAAVTIAVKPELARSWGRSWPPWGLRPW